MRYFQGTPETQALLEKIDQFLKYPRENICRVRKHEDEADRNMGYPIVMLVLGCIDFLGFVLYGHDKARVSKYIKNEMGEIDPIYRLKFKQHYTGKNGKARDSFLASLLYSYFRNGLMHTSNSIFPFSIDATDATYDHHLAMGDDHVILINAFKLFDDFLNSYELLKEKMLVSNDYAREIGEKYNQAIDWFNSFSSEVHSVLQTQSRIKGRTDWGDYPRKL